MKSSYFALTALLVIFGCRKQTVSSPNIQTLKTNSSDAIAPYLTHNHKGEAILCWTEKERQDSVNVLKYASFDDAQGLFRQPAMVTSSKGMSTTAESMAKIAFKSDGTAFAFFCRRFENEKNPFAGAIYYSSSSDEGRTWSAQRFLHSDTAHSYGRSFFDVSALKDGQIAAVWLDGRYGKSIKGSALFFARTSAGKGFDRDSCLDKGTCECCRTDLLLDKSGNLHLAYRKITYPGESLGKQVRDMVYQYSNNSGKTFSAPQAISKDNWAIEACPHSGPTLALNDRGVSAIWFTAGGTPGLYASTRKISTNAFSTRNLVSESGRHPQMVSLPNGQLALVCEEPIEVKLDKPMNMGAGHSGMQMSYTPAAAAKIILRVLQNNNTIKTIEISDGHFRDSHAVIATSGKSLIVVWVREEAGQSSICYAKINQDNLQV